MVKGTQGRTFAEHPGRKLYAQPGTAEGNPEAGWRSAKAGNPHGSRPCDSAGNRAEVAKHLGAFVFRQQLWLPSETERPTGDPEGKGICGRRIQIHRIRRPVQIFRYAEPRTAYDSVTPTDTGYARTALNKEVSEKRSHGEWCDLQNRRRFTARRSAGRSRTAAWNRRVVCSSIPWVILPSSSWRPPGPPAWASLLWAAAGSQGRSQGNAVRCP